MTSSAPTPDEAFETKLPTHLPRGLGQTNSPVAARWTRPSELKGDNWQWKPGAWFLGYRAGMAIGRQDDRHMLLVAGSRAGKGVSVILPNCLLWAGSMLAIDPKGELADKTAGSRKRMGQRVVVLDPFGISKHPTGSYNPLAEIPDNATDAADRATLIADALIVNETGHDAHWTDGAKQILKALILYTLTLPKAERDLTTVRDLLMLRSPRIPPPLQGEPLNNGLFFLLTSEDGPKEAAAIRTGIGRTFLAKPDKEAASILSTAQTQTDFLDSEGLRKTLRSTGEGLTLAELKRQRLSVFLCLPAMRMGTHARWLRIVVNLALAALETTPAKKGEPPVLLVLEEFNVLGHMASIAAAAGQIAGFGVRLLTVLQDLTQLQHHYKASWETFIGNAGFVLAFANSDATTLKYLSDKLGSISISVENRNETTLQQSQSGATGLSYSTQSLPLLSPAELQLAFARVQERLLVLFADGRPIILRRSISHDDPRFRPMLDLPL